jgi:hypothetical protein
MQFSIAAGGLAGLGSCRGGLLQAALAHDAARRAKTGAPRALAVQGAARMVHRLIILSPIF